VGEGAAGVAQAVEAASKARPIRKAGRGMIAEIERSICRIAWRRGRQAERHAAAGPAPTPPTIIVRQDGGRAKVTIVMRGTAARRARPSLKRLTTRVVPSPATST
jgi:hypothetical protein